MKAVINRHEYRDKVLACWLGKNIGGTLGMPFEWKRQVNNVEFYPPDHSGQPAPNDDLDIQLLWLVALERHGPGLDARTLADYWCRFLSPYWNEYGTAKVNMQAGLMPPMCGSLNNVYKHSCGAYIRSEIWACVAPGQPELAAAYAYEDAVLDHGDGEGTFAEVFFAALESAAFVHHDLEELIDIGLSYIPEDCAVAKAIALTRECHHAGKGWLETRHEILRQYRGAVPCWVTCSEEDTARGLGDGPAGYDVPGNVAITILALLEGGDDFSRIICTAVNCGEDTDCTAATAASIYGIIHGTKAIPQRWIDPIGRSIVTVAINRGDCQVPNDVDELTERTVSMMERVLSARGDGSVRIADEPTCLGPVNPQALRCRSFEVMQHRLRGPVFQSDFLTVSLDYGEEATIRTGVPKTIGVRVHNHNMQANLSVRWYLPAGWSASPAEMGTLFVYRGSLASFEVTLQAEQITDSLNRGVLEFVFVGSPTVVLVPITLMRGDYMQPQRA